MPSNPIQRKTRNAFLLGMLIMLIVAAAIIAVLYFTVFSEMFAGVSNTGGTTYAYVLTSEVKSGETIEASKLEARKVLTNSVPLDYLADSEGIVKGLYKSKVDLKAGTVISNGLVYKDSELADSARFVEYNMLTLPSTLRVGDYIDIRFTIPSGQNYIVLSKKEVITLNNTTVGLYLTEDEILMMSGAVIESYIMKASNLQAVQYVEAGMQEASTPTYAINSAVRNLMASDASKANIKDYSMINKSINDGLRAEIEEELVAYYGFEVINIQEGIEKEKEASMELYLSGLQGY